VQLGTAPANQRSYASGMATFITYRRTGGIFTLLAVAAAGLAAIVLTVAAAVTVAIVGTAVAMAALGTRAMVSAFSRHRMPRAAAFRTADTIEASVVRLESDAR
jgi:hypothetical protein